MIKLAASLSTGIPVPVYEYFASSPGAGKLTQRLQRDYRHSQDEAEDLLSDALIIASREFASLGDVSRLDEWIWATVLDQIWRRKRVAQSLSKPVIKDSVVRNLRDLRGEPEDHLQAMQVYNGIGAALDQLTKHLPIHASALRLFVLEQLTISEIAGILGMSQSTVKKYLSEARIEFRSYLERSRLVPDAK